MTDIVSALVDRLIDLLRERSESRRRLFKEHLDPLFADLAAIHVDYRLTFETLLAEFAPEFEPLKGTLASGGKWRHLSISKEEILQRIGGHKAVLEHQRIKSVALANALCVHRAGDLPEEVSLFLERCIGYFQVGAGDYSAQPRLTYTKGHYSNLLDQITAIEAGKPVTAELLMALRSLLNLTIGRWSDLTASYAAARVALLK